MKTLLSGKVLAIIAALLILSPLCMAADAPAKGPGAPSAEKLGWRLGCQAYTFRDFTFFEAVDKNAALGLKVIEAYPGQKLSADKPDVLSHDMSEEAMAAVKAKLASAGVTLVNYGVVSMPGDEAKWRKVFDFAKKMGIETITAETPPDAMGLMDKLTEEYKINIAIHNHPKPSMYWNHETLLKAVEGHSKRIGSCADTGHWMRSGVDPLQALKALNGRIISLHLKDLSEFGNKNAIDVPWGSGKADMKAMMAELKKQGFKGVISIEYEDNNPQLMDNVGKCVANFEKLAAELAK